MLDINYIDESIADELFIVADALDALNSITSQFNEYTKEN